MTYEIPATVTTQTELATESYLGHDIRVVSIRRQQAEYTSTGTFRDGETWTSHHPATDYTQVVGFISGYTNGVRLSGKNSGDPATIIKACRKIIDQDAYDASIRDDVTSLIQAVNRADFTGQEAARKNLKVFISNDAI